MLTREQKIYAIVDAMQEAYEAEGVDGDFDDARRYFAEDASNEEIDDEYEKWVTSRKQT